VKLSFTDGVPACKPYDEETGEGCQASDCQGCVWTRFVCADCQRFEDCDYKYKPKILSSNAQALSEYSFCLKFQSLPHAGGLEDQSHRKLSQFQIIMDEVAKQEKIERERLEKKNG